jgi:hypothetical protein
MTGAVLTRLAQAKTVPKPGTHRIHLKRSKNSLENFTSFYAAISGGINS